MQVKDKKDDGYKDKLPVWHAKLERPGWINSSGERNVKIKKGLIKIPSSEPTLTQSTAGDTHGAGSTQMRALQREVRSGSSDADNPSSLWYPAQSCTIEESEVETNTTKFMLGGK